MRKQINKLFFIAHSSLLIITLLGGFLGFNPVSAATAVGVNGGTAALGAVCDPNKDQCGADLSCDVNSNKCVNALQQGASCDPNNNLCDEEKNLQCTSNGTSNTCTSISSLTNPSNGAVTGSVPTSNPNCTGTNPDATQCLINPLPSDSLLTTFLVIIKGFMGALGVCAVLFIIVGAFQMIMASGSEEAYSKGKKTITWSILGLVIALMAFTIIAIVQNVLVTTTPSVSQFIP